MVPVVVLGEFWLTCCLTCGSMVTPELVELEDVPLWLLVLIVPFASDGFDVSPCG